MSVSGLEHYSKDQLIEELINRQTFVGIVVYHRGDAKSGQLEQGEIVLTKSPPLTREGVEHMLRIGASLVPTMFVGAAADSGDFPRQLDPPPFRVDEGGVVRLGQSRVSLDVVVEQYENGMSPEDIVRAYDSLAPADVYATIAFYLRHRDDVSMYLKRRHDEAESLRREIEAGRPRLSREELAHRSTREKANAPAGQ